MLNTGVGFRHVPARCVRWPRPDLKPGGATIGASDGGTAMQTQTANAQTAPAPAAEPLTRRMWAPVMIALGLGLTAAWTGLLGYGLVSLIALAF